MPLGMCCDMYVAEAVAASTLKSVEVFGTDPRLDPRSTGSGCVCAKAQLVPTKQRYTVRAIGHRRMRITAASLIPAVSDSYANRVNGLRLTYLSRSVFPVNL